MKQFMKLCGALLMSSISISVAQFPNGFGNLPNNVPNVHVPSGPRNWPSNVPKPTLPPGWPSFAPTKLTLPTNWPTNFPKVTLPTNWPTNFPTVTGDGIKCYVCASCDTPTGLMNCGTGSTQCITVSTMGIVARSCGASGKPNTCTKVNLLGMETETCYCDTDACNGDGVASTAVPTSTTSTSIDSSPPLTKSISSSSSSPPSSPPATTRPSTDGITNPTEPMEGSGEPAKNTSAPTSPTPSTFPATTKDDLPSKTLKCYECSDCATRKGLTKCPVGTTQCLKVVTGDSVVRSCGAGENTDSCTSFNAMGINTKTCSCNTDSCNGAGSLKGFTVLATVVAAFLAKMLM